METSICPHCGQDHPSGTRFCPKTGLEIAVPFVCPSCGKPIEAGWKVCAYCGGSLTTVNQKNATGSTDQFSKSWLPKPMVASGMIVLLVLVVGILSILIFRGFREDISPTNASITVVPSPTEISENPLEEATQFVEATTPTLITAQSPCGVNNWRIIAVLKEEQATSPGLKKVYVQFAIHNGSPIWGQLDLYRAMINPPTAATEDGFTYPGKLESGGRWSGGALVLTPQSVPSGLTMYLGASADNAEQGAAIFFSFEVAEMQKSLLVTFPAVTVLCYESSEKMVEDTTSMKVDVDKDLSQPPDIAKEFDSLSSITDGIEVKDVGRFDLVSATTEPGRTSDTQYLTVRLKFTNASSGYKTAGGISTYLFGNNGAMYRSMLVIPQFEAGPGLSSEVELKYILFSGSQSKEYALAIEQIITEPDYKTILVYKAYKLPSNSNSTSSNLVTSLQCKNDYYSVVKGAKREFKYTTDSQANDVIQYQTVEITEVFEDRFTETSRFSETEDYSNPSISSITWVCLPEGIAFLDSGPGGIVISKEIEPGNSWQERIGTDAEVTFTALSAETVTVPAGTFDTVKVEIDNPLMKVEDYFAWYAPQVGVVKYVLTQDDILQSMELISYSIPNQ